MSSAEFSQSELRYRRLFEAAKDGILIVDPDTRKIVDVNPYLLTLLGYTFEEVVGKELFEIGLHKDEAHSQADFRQLRANGYIRYDDLPLEARDGRRLDVEFVSNLYDEGERQIIQCNIRDISARKRAGLALRESEERFKLVVRAVSDSVWDWNLVTGKRWWSDGFMATFGYVAAEIEPGIESWTSRIHPDERSLVVEGMQQIINGNQEAWAADYRFQRKDGRYAYVMDRGFVLRDATGKGTRMVGGMRDLTEQKLLEAQYLRAQRMDSIGSLAGGIAHDLNNVFTPIMIAIELIKSDSDDDPNRAKVLDIIDVSCRRGADLVKQVLSFARGLDGQRVAVRLGHLIGDLSKMIHETFPRNIRIVSQVPASLWPVAGDPTQLHQVLLNLAVNARDAMPHGGTLTLVAGNLTLDSQFAGTSQEAQPGPHVLLQVIDTGLGIPPEVRDRIFEAFFTTKTIDHGTGLGLATVHSIVKSHGGFLHVESAVGEGTTFKVYLPANPALRTAESMDPFKHSLPRGRNELVMVVDDEESIRLITQQTLETFGYRVLTAANGGEAITLYAKRSLEIALVITDIMMPEIDGEATIRTFKAINPAVRIIATSGIDSRAVLAKDTKGMVTDFLPKPYTAQTLLRRVRKALDHPVVA